ncbi:MAG TPA: SDR family oxidoreductase [Acidimicrobiales bacterium]|nr:SDR family oxidoreductase [Acidimicrobiales bacterium]
MSTERVVVVTGASTGIGRSVADRLHRDGWHVIGASRRGTGPEGGWTPVTMDVDDDRSVTTVLDSVIGTHGSIHALVACAGWGLAGPVEQTQIGDAKAQLETNFWGAVRVVQSVLPIMRRQAAGRIILVSSIGGVIGIPFQAFYSASKFAMEGYGEALAYEVAPFGIHVSLVQPGNVRTDFTGSRRKVNPPEGDNPYARTCGKAVELMERDEASGVPPEDVSAVIAKLLGDKRPRRRVSVGKMGERVGIVAKRVLPHRLFESAAKSSLGV